MTEQQTATQKAKGELQFALRMKASNPALQADRSLLLLSIHLCVYTDFFYFVGSIRSPPMAMALFNLIL